MFAMMLPHGSLGYLKRRAAGVNEPFTSHERARILREGYGWGRWRPWFEKVSEHAAAS